MTKTVEKRVQELRDIIETANKELSWLTINATQEKYSPTPWKVEFEGNPDNSGVIAMLHSDDGWYEFASVAVWMEGSEYPSPTGLANLSLFMAAPEMEQLLRAYVKGAESDRDDHVTYGFLKKVQEVLKKVDTRYVVK